jgi:hypothetical protein
MAPKKEIGSQCFSTPNEKNRVKITRTKINHSGDSITNLTITDLKNKKIIFAIYAWLQNNNNNKSF